jgi:hypothetical protein
VPRTILSINEYVGGAVRKISVRIAVLIREGSKSDSSVVIEQFHASAALWARSHISIISQFVCVKYFAGVAAESAYYVTSL